MVKISGERDQDQTTEMSNIELHRIYAKYRKRIGTGEQFIKTSEYSKQYESKDAKEIPGTDLNIYGRPVATPKKWEKPTMSIERSTSYNRQYPGAQPSVDKLSKDKDLRRSFANRNSCIIGNNFASMEQDTNFRKSFVAPQHSTLSRGTSRHESCLDGSKTARDVRVKAPYGYRSALEGTTTYNKTFVPYQIKYCPDA